jgi:ribosome-associated protein
MKNGLEPELKKYVDAIRGRQISHLVGLDVHHLTSVADVFFICSGRSHRHVSAIAEHIRLELKKDRIQPLSVEGSHVGHWVVLDYGHVVIHVFYEPTRAIYDLEGLWADAPQIDTGSTLNQSGDDAGDDISDDMGSHS